MTTFNDIEPVKSHMGWLRQRMFSNGWGVSIIPEVQDKDFCEVAVMSHESNRHAKLTSESGLFGGEQVSRHHTVEEVDRIIQQIETLPDRGFNVV